MKPPFFFFLGSFLMGSTQLCLVAFRVVGWQLSFPGEEEDMMILYMYPSLLISSAFAFLT